MTTEPERMVLHDLDSVGYACAGQIIDDATTSALTDEIDRLLLDGDRRRPGVRRVIDRSPAIAACVAASSIDQLPRAVAGQGARIIRSLIFDKTPETNWLVPWHQDPTIAVRERYDINGYGPWNNKDGVPHCQPPLEILRSIVVIRIHLDDCPVEKGPLRVIPRSHRLGVLDDQRIDELAAAGPIVDCTARRGDAVLLTPLTIHSSAKATAPHARRRVLHLEYSAASLPMPLRWAEDPS